MNPVQWQTHFETGSRPHWPLFIVAPSSFECGYQRYICWNLLIELQGPSTVLWTTNIRQCELLHDEHNRIGPLTARPY